MSYYGPILTVTVLILLLEIAMGRHRGIYRKSDALVIGLAAILNPLVTRSLAGMVIAAAARTVAPQGQGAWAHFPLLPSYLLLLLLVEFAFYWVHRWAHEGQRKPALRWLWKIHRTHHAGKYMNVLVTLRINLFWSFVVPTSWLTGFAIYLGQGAAAALVILTIYGWNLVTHSHFRWDDAIRRHPRFGWAFRAGEHVLISPGMHHTHHGFGKDGASYRNYAVTFAFLDWMFGTLHIPTGRPWRYGLPGPQPHWAEEVFYPLIRLPAGAQESREDEVAGDAPARA
ncbi:sterol desaturase family protein [Sphingobium aromaticiconvertens]|uniref:sterol desaturase family protein n=1 Tax=Sphingobium aromaticiconvertens TaxID=365341 RepID=UPI0030166CAA